MPRKKTPPTSSSVDPATRYAERVVAGEVVAGPHVRAACRRHLEDLKAGHKRGLSWHPEEVARVLEYFEVVLTVEVEFQDDDGETVSEAFPFEVHESQAFILGSLFGWRNKLGHRRFRRAYVEIGKGNGKSPLAAGIGHYMMTATRKLRAEVYSAATDKDQAAILFRDAVEMWRRSPALYSRLVPSGQNPVWQLTHMDSASFFKPISSEKKGKSGIRPYCGLIDEVHEHPDNSVIEMMRAGTKGNQQALIFEITNSGHDRTSVCWKEHEYSIDVASGVKKNDSWFSYVCALDDERTETYGVDVAIKRMASCCTCNVKTTLIDLPEPRAFASVAISDNAGSAISKTGKDAKTIRIDRLLRDAFATRVTRGGGRPTIRSMRKSEGSSAETGSNEIANFATSGTGDTESERNSQSRTGKPTERAAANTELARSKSKKSSANRVGDAPFADDQQSVYGWITATAAAISEDCSATSAIQESVCSEIASRIYGEHSNTCAVRQRFRLQHGRLTETIPADDPFEDESCWVKVNPLLGVSIHPEFVREQVLEAKGMPSKESLVRRLHFCQWTDGEESWISKTLWQSVEHELDLDDFKGRECYGGLDLSYTKDLSAFAIVFPSSKGFDSFVYFWKPKDGLKQACKDDGVDYDLWVKDGYLLVTEGKVIKLGPIGRKMAEISDKCRLLEIAYDRYRHRELADDLADLGIDLPMIEHPQGFRRATDNPLWMPKSVQDLENSITESRLRSCRNPLMQYNVSSTVVRQDPAGTDNRIFDKKKSRSRIDGVVALAMAVGLATERCGGKKVYPVPVESFTETLS